MIGLKKAFVFSTLFLSAFASPAHHHDDEMTNWEKFSALLDTVDEGALHRVLHALSPKFKDGVFSKDRTAIEHVHSENPIVASKLVHIAKRQGSNSTIITSASTSATSSSPQQTSSASSVSSVASASSASSSRSASISSAISSALSSEITASTVPPPTSILVAPSSPPSATPVATQSGAVVYSTMGGGVVTLTSSAVGVSFERSTSTHIYYATVDGNIQTSTAVVVVNAPVTQTAAATGAAGAATTTGGTGLQNGAAQVASGSLFAAFAAVFGLAAYL